MCEWSSRTIIGSDDPRWPMYAVVLRPTPIRAVRVNGPISRVLASRSGGPAAPGTVIDRAKDSLDNDVT